MRTQVAVVGAGPVGMTAAALLAAYGVTVTVLERNATTSDQPKAISLDDEALRVYQAAGLADRILRIIVPGTGTRYYDRTHAPLFHARAEVPYRFGYPFKNPFAQPDLEHELAAHLDEHPLVDVRMRTRLDALTQDADGVTLSCQGSPLRAGYVLGCDGGRSTVREALDVPMTGRAYDDVWLVADVLDDAHTERFGMHVGDPDRPHVIVPGQDGRCRYEFLLHPGEGRAGTQPPFELVRKLLAPFRDLTRAQVQRAVTYRFNALVADRWRVGRVFLLGDAAHMMPPFAGQGLNSGVRDAANLCWKVADVLKGRLDDKALDTYEQERRPHAEATVRLSERLGRIVMTTNHRFAARRDAFLQAALSTPATKDYLEHMRYRPPHVYRTGLLVSDEDGLAGRAIGQPRAFDTVAGRVRPLDDVLGTGWALLAVDVPPDEAKEADVYVTLDDRLPRAGQRTLIDVDGGLDREFTPYRGRFVLVRPDRFVAATWPPGQRPDLAGVSPHRTT